MSRGRPVNITEALHKRASVWARCKVTPIVSPNDKCRRFQILTDEGDTFTVSVWKESAP